MAEDRLQSTTRLMVKVTVFTVLVPGTVAGLLPYLLLGRPSLAEIDVLGMSMLGAIPIALGASLDLHCARHFVVRGRGTPAPMDPPAVLVTLGPYGHTRNPMYIGVLSMIAGEAMLFRSTTLAVYFTVVAGMFHTFIVG